MESNLQPTISRHAAARMQQRGIPSARIEQLLAFGREVHEGHGGVIVYFDRAARRRAERAGVARGHELDRLWGMYAVVTGGMVATVGHRYRRVRRR